MTDESFSIIVPSMGREDLLETFIAGFVATGTRKYEVCFGLDPSAVSGGGEVEVNNSAMSVRTAVAPTLGMSAAMNRAFSLATQDWIIWLCDDMVPLPGWDLFPPLHQDRILCFDLLEPLEGGSFPPAVMAGDNPENFEWWKAVKAAQDRPGEKGLGTTPGGFFGTAVFHRSRWVPWETAVDPYTINDITWFRSLYDVHPDLVFGRMHSRCLYHFVRGSVRHRPDINAPDGEQWGRWFLEKYGVTIDQAYRAIDKRSEGLWRM